MMKLLAALCLWAAACQAAKHDQHSSGHVGSCLEAMAATDWKPW